MSSFFIPRLVVFGICVIAFFIGLYFNKRDDEREQALYDERRRQAHEQKEQRERERQQEQERLLAQYRERTRLSSATTAMTEESQPQGLGGGAAGQVQGQQSKRTIIH